MKLSRFTLTVLIALAIKSANLAALEAEYVGSFSDSLFAPTCLSISDDHLAVLEPYSKRVNIYTADGRITQKVDILGDASGLARLSENIYLFCDRAANNVEAVNLQSGVQYQYVTEEYLAKPVDITVSEPYSYILDAGNREIVIVNSNRQIQRRISLNLPGGETIGFASSFAYYPDRQIFYVFDQLASMVLAFSLDGEFRGAFGTFGNSLGAVSRGGDIACDTYGNVYITDRFQGSILVYSPEGEFLATISLAEFGESAVSMPTGLALDEQGFLYVASTEGRKIHMIFIHADGSQEQALSALQAYPEDNDTLDMADVKLVAYINNNLQNRIIAGFDFQLYAADLSEEPLAEVFDVEPETQADGDSLEYSIMAEWDLTEELDENETYQWRVRAKSGSFTGEWSVLRRFHTISLPRVFNLEQNYPNPFNPATHIAFDVPMETDALITIYNMLGQIVTRFEYNRLPAGRHELIWNGVDSDGNSLASGVYFYRLTAQDFSKTRKMVILK